MITLQGFSCMFDFLAAFLPRSGTAESLLGTMYLPHRCLGSLATGGVVCHDNITLLLSCEISTVLPYLSPEVRWLLDKLDEEPVH